MRDPDIAEAARKAAAFHNGKDGFGNSQKLNVYQCESVPSHMIVTIDREPGVTPFLTGCELCGPRKSMMKSAFYRVHPHLKPTHEWYRPDTFEGLSPWSEEHVLKGGLLLRKIAADGGAEQPPPTDPDDASGSAP